MTFSQAADSAGPSTQLSAAPLYGLVGSGRLAKHLAFYLRSQGLRLRIWSREQPVPARQALADCDYLLLAIADSAIEPWLRETGLGDRSRCVHFSGALSTSLATGFHPLMTFAQQLYSEKTYAQIHFICERQGLGFAEVFPTLANSHHYIRDSDKAYYHSLCVLSGNYSVLLWQKLFEELEQRMGIPHRAALPYLRQITENIDSDYRQALTGPLQRGDTATIRKNLAALQSDSFQQVYQAFINSYSGNQAQPISENVLERTSP